jgi:hypothetical protein
MQGSEIDNNNNNISVESYKERFLGLSEIFLKQFDKMFIIPSSIGYDVYTDPNGSEHFNSLQAQNEVASSHENIHLLLSGTSYFLSQGFIDLQSGHFNQSGLNAIGKQSAFRMAI